MKTVADARRTTRNTSFDREVFVVVDYGTDDKHVAI